MLKKLLYTDICNPLTKILVKEAERLAQEGACFILHLILFHLKRERCLALLENHASFAITTAFCADGTLFCPQ